MTTGVIFDIKKFAIHDGPGLRTAVFFKGCPLDCRACHNPEGKNQGVDLMVRHERCTLCGDCLPACGPAVLSLDDDSVTVARGSCDLCGACIAACLPGALEIAGREVTVAQLMAEIERDVVFYDQSGGGVTFSGGEPLGQPEFLLEILRCCRARDISTTVDTSGFAPLSIVQAVAAYADLFLYDLKLLDEPRHVDFAGASNRPILRNLAWLSGNGSAIVVRFPFFPGVNDDPENVRALGEFVASLPHRHTVDVLPYHRAGIGKYARLGREYLLPETRPPSAETTAAAVAILRDTGVRVTVRGECHDNE